MLNAAFPLRCRQPFSTAGWLWWPASPRGCGLASIGEAERIPAFQFALHSALVALIIVPGYVLLGRAPFARANPATGPPPAPPAPPAPMEAPPTPVLPPMPPMPTTSPAAPVAVP